MTQHSKELMVIANDVMDSAKIIADLERENAELKKQLAEARYDADARTSELVDMRALYHAAVERYNRQSKSIAEQYYYLHAQYAQEQQNALAQMNAHQGHMLGQQQNMNAQAYAQQNLNQLFGERLLCTCTPPRSAFLRALTKVINR